MQAVLHTEPSVFRQFKPVWNDLVQRSYANTVFSTWEWLSTWWDVYCPGDLYVITVHNSDGNLAGIAPWFRDNEGVIRGIGCIDVTDYIDLIVDQSYVDEVLNCLSAFLVGCWTDGEIQICNIPDGSLTLKGLTKSLEDCNFLVESSQIDVCPIINLPSSWDEYLQLLDKKQRHEVRRKLRRAYGSGLEIEHFVVNGVQNLDKELDVFFELMASSDPEKEKFLENDTNVEFFRRLTKLMYQKGWLELNFLKLNDEFAAAYLNFKFNNHILIYNSGLKYEPYGHLSPGIVLLAHIIQRAIDDGIEVLDFLRGDETYKYRMGGRDTAIHKLTAHPAFSLQGVS